MRKIIVQTSLKESIGFGAAFGLLYSGAVYILPEWVGPGRNYLRDAAMSGGIMVPLHYVVHNFVFPYVWPAKK